MDSRTGKKNHETYVSNIGRIAYRGLCRDCGYSTPPVKRREEARKIAEGHTTRKRKGD